MAIINTQLGQVALLPPSVIIDLINAAIIDKKCKSIIGYGNLRANQAK